MFLSSVLQTIMTLGSFAHADVNMKDAAFIRSFIDIETPELRVVRTYSSRSLHSGLFGTGWCSNLEARLREQKITSMHRIPKKVEVDECGWITKYEQTSEPGSYTTGLKKFGSLNWDGQIWTETTQDGIRREYDRTGRLISFKDSKTRRVHVIYDNLGRPKTLVSISNVSNSHGSNSKPLALIHYNDQLPTVQSIQIVNGNSIEYEYENQTLRSATNAWKNTYRFEYDLFKNLALIQFPDGSLEKVTYDNFYDRITSFQGRDFCKEHFNYEVKQNSNSRYVASIATKSCINKIIRKSTYEFWYERTPTGRIRLIGSKIKSY
jgi:uncharacterized protein RhaS with RHS repeats